jgi:hypothetical protein
MLLLEVHTSWGGLSQGQLRDALKMMDRQGKSMSKVPYLNEDDYKEQVFAATAAMLLLRWSGVKVVCRYTSKELNNGYMVKHKGKTVMITDFDLYPAILKMSWLKDIPEQPVRLDCIGKRRAVAADLTDGFSFENWLVCENLWQGYQLTQREDLLAQMAGILYQKPGIKCKPFELIGVFYWWAAVKIMMKKHFPDFFRDAAADGQEPDYDMLRRTVDAQLRAITKGDPTKEKEVLALDVWRVLTELNAQAREYEELNKKYGKQL